MGRAHFPTWQDAVELLCDNVECALDEIEALRDRVKVLEDELQRRRSKPLKGALDEYLDAMGPP